MRTIIDDVSCKQHHENTVNLDQHYLAEDDILLLHQKFLTPGFHVATTHDKLLGREHIIAMLTSLNYYKHCAYLSEDEFGLDEYVPLYQELCLQNCATIDDYFFNQFAYDFIWIEQTSRLINQNWYTVFIHKLTEFGLNEQLPIVYLQCL